MPNILFSEFPAISKKEWLAKVEKDLKGKSLEELQWEISDDWTVSPFAHADDLGQSYQPLHKVKQANNSWEIGERILVEETKVANQEALHALESGVNALLFLLPENFYEDDFELLLKNIQLEWISIHFEVSSKLSIEYFLAFLEKTEFDLSKIKGSWRSVSPELQQQNILPNFKFFIVDGTAYYKDTAYTIEELSQIFKAFNDQLEKIEAAEAHNFHLSLAVGESYFINIAKIRAIKILWYNLMQAYGLEEDLTLEVHLSNNSWTEDVHQNMIKSSIQALSAVVGGVDRLFIAPADKNGTLFTKRIARNVQHLLQLESHLDQVIDPATGSYYVEQLTTEMVEKVWSNLS